MIKVLQQHILSDLPGWEAHKKMAPPIRQPLPNLPKNVRYSAVCILIFQKNSEPHTLLIKRTEDGKVHSGQISFPGGRLDSNDFSLTYCALRECEEEIGLSKNNLHILGSLSELYIPPSNFLVTPIVCTSERVKNLIRSADEVAEIIEVPLQDLFKNQNKVEKEVWGSGAAQTMEAPTYQFKEHTIWGATAMMLAELEELFLRST